MGRIGRWLLAALLCALLAALWAVPGVAEASLGAYRLELLPDGGTRYAFDEAAVTTPASWKGKVVALEYGDWVAFCHEKSNALWRQASGDETGGLLFGLCVSESTDFREGPAYQELGRTDRGYYYLTFPTDLQAYNDEAVTEEYLALWADIDAVKQTAELLTFHAGPAPEASEALAAAAFDPASAPYDGDWVTFEDGFKLYVPTSWQALELTEAETAAGIFYRAGDGAMGAAVSYLAAGELETREDLARDFEQTGFSGVQPLTLNGIEAIGFERPADGYRGVAFFHPSVPGYVLIVYVSPLGQPGTEAYDIASVLLDSVTPWNGQ